MDVQKATANDLATVLGWLEREYAEDDGDGFWCNRSMIERALEDGDLWVIRRDSEAVAFQVGDYAADIVSVRREHRRQGLGDALFAAALDRAAEDNVNVLSIECMPCSSWPFWRRHGFERYGDMSEWGKITARRVLTRSFDIPSGLPSADVAISFYPEAATYSRDVPPISLHQVRGGRLDDGAIMLGRPHRYNRDSHYSAAPPTGSGRSSHSGGSSAARPRSRPMHRQCSQCHPIEA